MHGCSPRDQEGVSLAQLLLDIHTFDERVIHAPDFRTAIECSLDDCSSEMAIEQHSSAERI